MTASTISKREDVHHLAYENKVRRWRSAGVMAWTFALVICVSLTGCLPLPPPPPIASSLICSSDCPRFAFGVSMKKESGKEKLTITRRRYGGPFDYRSVTIEEYFHAETQSALLIRDESDGAAAQIIAT